MKYMIVCKTREDAEDLFDIAKDLAGPIVGIGCSNYKLIIFTRTDEFKFLSKSAFLRRFNGIESCEILTQKDFEDNILVKWREANEREKSGGVTDV